MKRMRLNKQERSVMHDMALETISLRENWNRRLRNALIALAAMDPQWMIWIEEHVASPCHVPAAAKVVELRARELMAQGYRYLGDSMVCNIIEGDRPFSDNGNLVSG
jgi:hypothetical protein